MYPRIPTIRFSLYNTFYSTYRTSDYDELSQQVLLYYRFLKEVTHHGNEKLLQNYLELHPDCSHLLAVLQHGRRDETDDITMW